eukprot:Skav233947  [mRNA]  locus=scaffold1382:104117:113314:+ [translate_table: standard]
MAQSGLARLLTPRVESPSVEFLLLWRHSQTSQTGNKWSSTAGFKDALTGEQISRGQAIAEISKVQRESAMKIVELVTETLNIDADQMVRGGLLGSDLAELRIQKSEKKAAWAMEMNATRAENSFLKERVGRLEEQVRLLAEQIAAVQRQRAVLVATKERRRSCTHRSCVTSAQDPDVALPAGVTVGQVSWLDSTLRYTVKMVPQDNSVATAADVMADRTTHEEPGTVLGTAHAACPKVDVKQWILLDPLMPQAPMVDPVHALKAIETDEGSVTSNQALCSDSFGPWKPIATGGNDDCCAGKPDATGGINDWLVP